jgi:hypothetical protein
MDLSPWQIELCLKEWITGEMVEQKLYANQYEDTYRIILVGLQAAQTAGWYHFSKMGTATYVNLYCA